MKTMLVLLAAAILCAGTVVAQDKKGTPAEAKALVEKAIAFVKENGKEKAFAAFGDPKGKFVIGDLYVFVYDMTGKCVAHGGNPKMIGKDLIDMKDADGKSFVKERVAIAKEKGKGWQDYKFSNPVSKAIEDKRAYVEKVDDVIVGCGAYSK
jgi:cytochrome c